MADITITAGNRLDVTYDVENTGGESPEQTVALIVDGVERDTDTPVVVGPNDTKSGVLRWNTTASDAVENATAEVAGPDSADPFTVTVKEPLSFARYGFDSDTLGGSSPGPWTSVNGTNAVSDAQAFSGSQSMFLQADGGGNGSRFIETSFTAGQYTDTFGFLYYETTNNSQTALEFASSSGDTLLFVGTNNPQVVAEGAGGYTELLASPSPEYGAWREFEVEFDWANTVAYITWIDRDGSSSTQSTTVSLKSATTFDLAEVAVTQGGDNRDWGGSGQDCYVDDVATYTS